MLFRAVAAFTAFAAAAAQVSGPFALYIESADPACVSRPRFREDL